MRKFFLNVLLLSSIVTGMTAKNPFFGKYKTPHETVPFDKIKIEHYEPAFDQGLDEQKKEIEAIANNPKPATFDNTIVALENAGELLTKVSNVFFNLLSTDSNDEMMEISQRISPKLSESSSNIFLNEKLFARVKSIYDNKNNLNLDLEQEKLLQNTYDAFCNRGANLSAEDKEKYRQLNADLSMLSLTFGQNALKETNKFEKVITDESLLSGLPESVKEAAATRAKNKGKDGYLFDLSAPSYIPFMTYADNRDLRKEMYLASNSRCIKDDELDNKEIIRKIANTRLEIARLMGYPNYANYTLRKRMAQNEENVYSLLNELLDAYKPYAQNELSEVQGFAAAYNKEYIQLMPWDWSYYSEKLKNVKFNVNDEMTRPYFELENVKKGVFGLATELYGITFKKNTKIPVFNKEAEAYEVFDANGNFVAVLYTDFHPRASKRAGAWMTEFKGQFKKDGKDSRPHVSIVMNFTPPTETTPSLLSFDEVNTFLHEFGHALHGMLSNVTYESLSGTSVYRDFVELPSQIMENWLTEKEFLDKFAVHYQTGEKIPQELVQKLIDAANFNMGYQCLRQLSFGLLDMSWHTIDTPFDGDVTAFEQTAWNKAQILPSVENTSMSANFGHIFSGGYAAGYYGYKWAEVLDADAFAAFTETGIFNKETAKSFYENILSKGGTEDPMELYIRFRGQKPTIDALLKSNGITR